MFDANHIVNNIFNAQIPFEQLALDVFYYQYQHNAVYQQWCRQLCINDPFTIQNVAAIPYLPIHFFKTHQLITSGATPEIVFESSGTTGSINSKHYVADAALYRKSYLQGFEAAYGNVRNYCILGLLPSYLERKGSSLVTMVDDLIRTSNHPQSGFYLYEHQALAAVLKTLVATATPTLLIGVTFALLDFAAAYPMPLGKHIIVMETGGMKGRRKELTLEQVHDTLKNAFQLSSIHSEYGMTELLSQAYAQGNGRLVCSNTMQVCVRAEDDPLQCYSAGRGVLNIIDLANVYSCSFIATDDIAEVYTDGSFRIFGRLDASDVRGCSLMVAH